MNKNVYKATFPLHEGRYDKDGPQGEKSDRRVGKVCAYSKINSAPFKLLFLEWAHWKNFYKKQPLWLIKRYFGDKVWFEELVDNPIHHNKFLFYISDWTLLCMAWILQPTADYSSSFWSSCVSLWSLDCWQLGYQLCRVCLNVNN